MRHLLLILMLFTVSCCVQKREIKTKFVYEDYVEIVDGFHRGAKGIITDFNCYKVDKDKVCLRTKYKVSLESSATEHEFNEEFIAKAQRKLMSDVKCYKKIDTKSGEQFQETKCDEEKKVNKPTSSFGDDYGSSL